MYKISVYILVLFFPVILFAQVDINGFVFNLSDGSPLAGANVLLEELSRGATSDENGQFRIAAIPAGRYTLSASFIGFNVSKKTIHIGEDAITVSFMLRPTILEGQTIIVTGTRAVEGETPVTFDNLSQQQISERYTASDVPMLLSEMPNTFSYSLTGDNLGYSFLKVRGFDQKRVGVMINGIPLNDPEDHQVYWVDMPDFAESVEDIQVQRGVGSSIYGTSTFGGSVNIVTQNFASGKSTTVGFGMGSFNTRKAMIEYKSGLVNNTYAFYGRFSKLLSDGYRRYSGSDLWAYFFGVERYDRDMVTRINVFGGREITHPDWYGVPESMLATDRRYKLETYSDAVDNFSQPHYQLIHDWKLSEKVNLKNSFYYVRGEGFYENLKSRKKLRDFGMDYFTTRDPGLFGSDSLRYYETVGDSLLYRDADGNFLVKRTDLVRRKWVKKNQYGWIGQLDYDGDDGKMTVGAAAYLFDSNHFGKVLWAKNMPAVYSAEREYYNYNGDRLAVSAYLNYLFDYSDNMKLFTNLLYEHKSVEFRQNPQALFRGGEVNRYEVSYDFVSPRLGLNYALDDHTGAYANISFARREPSDDDLYDIFTGPDDLGSDPLFEKADTVKSGGTIRYIKWSDPVVKPEQVLDYELGFRYNDSQFSGKINFYYMDFKNEIVAFGTVDKDGNPVKGNAGHTIHSGVEISLNAKPFNFLTVSGNLSFSDNYFKEFKQQEWGGGLTDMSGNTIAGFPDVLANLRLSGHWRQFSASLLYKYAGKQYLDNTQNDNRVIAPFGVADLSLTYRLLKLFYFPEIRLQLQVNNLFDNRYETAGYYDSWGGESWLYPAAGRNYYFGVTFQL